MTTTRGSGRVNPPRQLWFEAMARSLRLPAPVFVVALAIPFFLIPHYVALQVLFPGLAPSTYEQALVPYNVLTIAVMSVLALAAARSMEGLRDYTSALLDDRSQVDISLIFRRRGMLAIAAAFLVPIAGVYNAPGSTGGGGAKAAILGLVDSSLYVLVFMTFTWTWSTSMLTIYRIGKLPLKLVPFTEDRLLGMKRFASVSLRLTLMYEGIVLLSVAPDLIFAPPWVTPPYLLMISFLFLVGPALFPLPLISIRRKLLAEKRELRRMLGRQYTAVVAKTKEGASPELDERTALSLLAIDKMQRDVASIPSWPYDMGITVRLSAITLSVISAVIIRFVIVVLQV